MEDYIGCIYQVKKRQILPFGKSIPRGVEYVLIVETKQNSIAFFSISSNQPTGIKCRIKINNIDYYVEISKLDHLTKKSIHNEECLHKIGRIQEDALREIKEKYRKYEKRKKQQGIEKKTQKRNTSDVKTLSNNLGHNKQLKNINSFSQPCSGGKVNPR